MNGFGEETLRNEAAWKTEHRGEDNIKKHWIRRTQNRNDKSTIIKFSFSIKCEKFLD